MKKPRMNKQYAKEVPDSLSKQNFGLTPDAFEILLDKLKDGDESLFEKIFLSQFKECQKYLIIRFKIDEGLAYDCTMEALLKLRSRMLDNKVQYGNLRFFVTKMASQFLTDYKKRSNSLYSEKDDLRIDVSGQKDDVLHYLDKAWKLMCDECQNILSSYYYERRILKNIAHDYEMSETAMRKKKQRCLEKLRGYFMKDFKELTF